MERAAGLEKSVVRGKESLLLLWLLGWGGLEQGCGVREPLTPPGNVGERFSFSVLMCEASRIISYCSSAQLMGPLVMGGGATLCPPPMCIDIGRKKTLAC